VATLIRVRAPLRSTNVRNGSGYTVFIAARLACLRCVPVSAAKLLPDCDERSTVAPTPSPRGGKMPNAILSLKETTNFDGVGRLMDEETGGRQTADALLLQIAVVSKHRTVAQLFIISSVHWQVIVRPLSTVGYTSVVAIHHSRQWSN